MQLEMCVKTLRNEKRKAQIASFLTPWLSREIWTTLGMKSEIIMKHVNALSELKEKIMLAEGFDDDMRPITFEQICEKSENINA